MFCYDDVFRDALKIRVCSVIIPRDGLSPTLEYASCYTTFLKQVVYVLKLELIGFRKEAVNNGNPQSVEHCEDDERVPGNVADRNRRDLNHSEDTYPIDERANSLTA